MYKAVIFDMDGVLIDSQNFHYQADIDVIIKAGYSANMETVVPYTGISNPDRWPKYKESLNLAHDTETLINWHREKIETLFKKECKETIPGIPELLKYISEKGLKIALASSSHPELINIVLQQTGISSYFEAIVSGEDVENGKPAPDVFLCAAEKISVLPEHCIVIEDSPVGIKAAKNANMACIAYKNANTHNQDFSLADYVASDYKECRQWL